MKFLLDTNAVIAILKGEPVVLARLRQHEPADFGVPAIVAHELYYGAYKSQRMAANVARVEALQLEVVTFDAEDAQHAGAIRAHLTAAGTPIGPYDALIAGQARARRLVLVTHNMREFESVPGLQVEDWLAGVNES
ncbi:pilus assembly protein [Burkholderia stabilis]|uniref:type II toxin-antitoxin system VapC family toxin n=1 Tax=Burkholderia stabilis TaxID=95485 RepID=UPI0008517EB2|nr:type II toxin-antitoxin system VapC family toxin [Burkholderia stabilis]AOR69703.1 pilus assembly protein [Burkholderia stabilis]HDR9493084.1 type II toxin-antitoxin system VapC family toxin [Burkholderia stabilis]HDR9524795.1 type II toxin-antitoxin system VapC family toxin [Burkholderia stabilis]HDR9532472.1 type II toxin-antitoxin system VapC family toxin [Burkholderia stabilis]HDR9540255.1 type II toxin-antitoxin system VapC family toxin [Burkholderia stabilis]